ncbi:MAG: endonuclease, partial [Faecousia sp.]
MKLRPFRRFLAVILTLALLLGVFSGSMLVSAATLSANTGVRDTVCTALSSQAQAYYTGSNSYASLSQLSGVDSTDSYTATQNNPLYTALYNLMSSTRNSTEVVYSGTGTSSLAHYWGYTDAEAGSSTYLYFYTDVLSNDSSVSSLTMNREHVWPQSKASYYQLNGGADLHHLRPSISGVNQSKSNNAFANLIGTDTTYSAYQVNNVDVIWTGTKDFDNVLEVRDNIKGDVARILLYVYCRWQQPNLYSDVASGNLPALDSDDSSNSGERIIEDRATLLQWCQQDPVDEWEMQRNDQVENVQGNRNVFIDYPEFAWLMFGLTPPTDMVTPSGEAAGGASTVTITASSNNTAWGTVSVSGSTITASPAEGYYASGYEVTSGSATVTQSGNSFTVSATGNCTIKIIFSAKTPVTVSFSVPEGVTQAAVSGYAEEAITLPTPTGTPSATAQSYTFAGWVTASLEDTTTKPTILKAGDSFTTSTNTTLYALYTYTTGGSGTTEYGLVTSADQLVSGSTVVIAAAGYDYALSTTQNGNNRGQAVIVKNTTDNTIAFASDAGVAELTLGVGTTDGTWSFYDDSNSGYLYAASSSSNYLRTESAVSDNSSFAVTVTSDGTATLAAQGTNTRNYVRYNNSSKIFSCYASTTTTVQPVALYIATAAGTVYYTTVLESACDHVYTDVVTPATCTTDGYTTHTCSLCGYVYVDSTVGATGHSYDEGVITTAATCEEAGVKTFTCANCGDTYTEAIPSTGHNYVDGVCTNCGAAQGTSNTYRLITAESDLASGNYVLIVKAGGKNPGSYSYYALKRQADSSYVLAEAADTYVGTSETMPTTISVSDDTIVWDAAYDTAMTLSDGSTNVLYTTKSNYLYYGSGTASAWTLTFDSATGTFKFQTSDTASTTRYLGLRDDLTSTGSNGNPRFRCNSTASTTSYQFYLYLQETASHTHSGTAVAAKAPTCTEAGNQAYWTCTCGKLFSDAACTTETTLEAVTIAATGHNWVEATDGENYLAPTCTETGLAYMVCSVCGEVGEGREIPALGHDMVAGTVHPATCTEDGYTEYACSRCDATDVGDIVAATGHSEVTDAAVAPTCTETGLTEGSHCSVCNEVIVAQEVVPATGHTEVTDAAVAPTCTETGLTEGSHCSVCGVTIVAQEVVPATGHTEVTDAAVAPTCTTAGLTEGSHCSVCGVTLVA